MRVKTGAKWVDLGPRRADDWTLPAGEGLLGAGSDGAQPRAGKTLFMRTPGIPGARTHQQPADGLAGDRGQEVQ